MNTNSDNFQVTDPTEKLLVETLMNGRALTLIELSGMTGIRREEIKEKIQPLVHRDIVLMRGNRQRDYYFLTGELAEPGTPSRRVPSGIKYSRHCYKHLAGYVGVLLTDKLLEREYIYPEGKGFRLTEEGRNWFESMGINIDELKEDQPKFAKQCLDFSERRSHLGGRLGDALMKSLIAKGWIEYVPDSREMKVTEKGKTEFEEKLELELPDPS